ncbi:hypothetical protein WR25_01548 [Diploscapter pachys]|uniref:Protein kinase domain-containing protein n=1 Tax=Diploscapter pachys TaxID=2018661 RepID=A0A2A2K5M9_9BILA|nr:hypothetical protein WR25_01548 [Diploscapter pachys]
MDGNRTYAGYVCVRNKVFICGGTNTEGKVVCPKIKMPRDAWMIEPSKVETQEDRLLGKGAFSEVYVGFVSGRIPLFEISRNIEVHLHSNSKKDVVEVAVKRLQGHATDRDREDFYREIEIMKRLEYNLHIVSMYGYVPSKFVPLMILEYCKLGDILKSLTDNEENFKSGAIGIREITSFAWQVCDGMSYVASKDIVHRDLAARNVLLTKSHKAKIADFGLAIKSDESDQVARGLLPLKWTAPEAFTNFDFSSKRQRPYQDIASSDLVNYLREGNRLPKPELCPDEMYELMEKCWNMNPEDRLSFDELKSEISKCLLMITNYYGYLEAHEDSDSDNLSDIYPVSTTLE